MRHLPPAIHYHYLSIWRSLYHQPSHLLASFSSTLIACWLVIVPVNGLQHPTTLETRFFSIDVKVIPQIFQILFDLLFTDITLYYVL